MLAWISENLATIIITLVLVAIVTAIIIGMRKDKKAGKSSCGGKNPHEKAEFYTFVRSLDALKESLKGGQKTIILPENSPITEILSINY